MGKANEKIKERRRFPRKECLSLVFYANLNGMEVRGMGRILNLSQKGALIEIDKYLPPYTSIKLDIGMERFYHLKAKVIWSKVESPNKYLVGVEFDKVQEFPILKYL